MIDLLIRNGSVVTEDSFIAADIAIEGGVIVEMGYGLSLAARNTIDVAGHHLFPGVIDSHVHFNEPGRTDWEGVATGSAALAAGGGTCFFDMPLNSTPPVLDGETFDRKAEAAAAGSITDFALWGGLTPSNLDCLEELVERGVIGFKAFMSSSGIDDFRAADDYTLYRGMQIAAKLKLPVAVHAENDAICSALAAEAIAAGRVTMADYLASRPVVAEVEAIRRAISFAQDTGCALHVVHVSSIEGCRAIVEGRRLIQHCCDMPVDITCETGPHYLTFTADDAVRLGARAKCAPPLRDASNRDALIDQVCRGGIDMIASDHSPAPQSLKIGDDFFKIWGGIAGVQSTLPALLSLDHGPPPSRIAALTAGNVARRFGIGGKGVIAVGMDADLAIVDLGGEFCLEREDLLDRHKLSPYVGRTFRGVVKHTIRRGEVIHANGRIVAKSRGCLIRPLLS
ncbi:MAG TPA: allantoinase AllB [Tepidisphaeraceae bacterium]